MKKIFFIPALAVLVAGCSNKNTYDAAGYFEATEITVSSEATGRLIELDIAEGGKVEKGQSAGSIDSTQLYLNKMLLQKNVTSIVSNRPDVSIQIAALQSQLDKQFTEKTRVEKLIAADAAPTKQLDDINAMIDQLQKQIAAQKKSLQNNVNSIDAQSSAVEIQIATIDDQLSKCRLIAPATGTVLSTYVEEGEFCMVGKPLYKVADLDVVTLRAYVTSDKLSKIKIGQNVQVKAAFGGGNDREYTGTITSVASQSEFTPKSIPTDSERADMVYAVKISVVNDGYIKIGTYGTVIF